jgi:hypothetical protein
LFDGEEEAWHESEGDEPHRDDWFETVLAERLLADLEKDVGGNAVDEEADGYGNGSLRNRCARGTRGRSVFG